MAISNTTRKSLFDHLLSVILSYFAISIWLSRDFNRANKCFFQAIKFSPTWIDNRTLPKVTINILIFSGHIKHQLRIKSVLLRTRIQRIFVQ